MLLSGSHGRWSRRDFLKGVGLAGVAAAAGSVPLFGQSQAGSRGLQTKSGVLYQDRVGPSRVSLVKGSDRRSIVYQSLKLIEDDALSSLRDKQVLVKPNIVLADCPLCVTHVDAVRAVLDFLAPHVKKPILIGESSVHNTMEGFKNSGYLRLESEYNVKVVDLNRSGYQVRYVLGQDRKPVPIRIIDEFLDPSLYLVSVARMKTHNYVFVTLSLKNVLMAAPLNDYRRNDKGLMHTAPPAKDDLLHFNMFHLSREVYPDLAVVDGFEGMEGNGPAWGSAIESRVALAGRDALAVDTVATRVMGFDPKKVNYLAAMAEAGMGQGELGKMTLLGTPLDQCVRPYKPNQHMAELYGLHK
jgi:uncharacterized protein (DUF362 family)